ncbi:Glycine/D-amino acid oxidase [Oscillibacter sp. PC13]|uniref:FAD-dependent oxidoreductase n=1 Tax=Oscillibacter sp. PC13 TaxID=1855299 RepID=UPI0008E94C96|nr:Glycine/D-amino acid oxidase [Oscillibacter sp. PC13]
MPAFPHLEHDTKTDVLVIGGGLAGLLCAYTLAQRSMNYLLIESDTICSGISRNTTAKITSQHGLIYNKLIQNFGVDLARMYWEANQAALERYRHLSKAFPCDFEAQPAYVYSIKEANVLEKEMHALEQIGAGAEYVDTLPLPLPVTGAVKFENQAQFHPLQLAAGISRNLNIREHTAARAFEGNVVLTDYGKITASKIIVATHFPLINKHGAYFIKMYQHRSYVLALEHTPELDGMYVDEAKTGLSFRRYQNLLLLGGGSHRTGKQGGNWTELQSFARTYYPDAQERYRWSAQDCMTLDAVPYIGQYSRNTPNLYVATGFNKWGMTSSMIAATLLSDMAEEKETPYAAVFSPSRTVLRPQLLSNVSSAAVNLLSVSKHRCPHMGCALKWNPQEHSWDCPCHGSRFTEDGTLLDNPATDDLKRNES